MFKTLIERILPSKPPKDINKPKYRIVKESITVNSGKLVVANSFVLFAKKSFQDECLKNLMDTPEGKESDVNVNFWSSKGLCFIPTGNTSPNVFTNTNDSNIEFKSSTYLDKSDQLEKSTKTENETEHNVVSGGLWAICAIDYETLKTLTSGCKNENFESNLNDDNVTVIEVTPGTYRLEVLNKWDHDEGDPVIFGKLILIEEKAT